MYARYLSTEHNPLACKDSVGGAQDPEDLGKQYRPKEREQCKPGSMGDQQVGVPGEEELAI